MLLNLTLDAAETSFSCTISEAVSSPAGHRLAEDRRAGGSCGREFPLGGFRLREFALRLRELRLQTCAVPFGAEFVGFLALRGEQRASRRRRERDDDEDRDDRSVSKTRPSSQPSAFRRRFRRFGRCRGLLAVLAGGGGFAFGRSLLRGRHRRGVEGGDDLELGDEVPRLAGAPAEPLPVRAA